MTQPVPTQEREHDAEQPAQAGARGIDDAAQPDGAGDGAPQFRITVRKVPCKVQARGVLAE